MADPTECIFCRIIAGEIPSQKILETPDAVAFLDVGPLADGHTLLVPRRHYVTLAEIPSDEFCRIVEPLPRLAAAIEAVTGAKGYNVLQNNGRVAGQVVDHVHFHLIPRAAGDGLGYRWNAGCYPEGRAGELRERIQAALSG